LAKGKKIARLLAGLEVWSYDVLFFDGFKDDGVLLAFMLACVIVFSF